MLTDPSLRSLKVLLQHPVWTATSETRLMGLLDHPAVFPKPLVIADSSEAQAEERSRWLNTIQKKGSAAFSRIPPHMTQDREFILGAVSRDGSVLMYLTAERRSDKEIVLRAVKKDGTALRFASESMRKDKEVVKAAVRQRRAALMYASPELQNDQSCLKAAALKPKESNSIYRDEQRAIAGFINTARDLQWVCRSFLSKA